MTANPTENSEMFDQFKGTQSYLANEELQEAVNIAIALQRPLLIRGEPGTGKTLLAASIAEALDLPLHTWHVKSTSRAQEGLYHYDAVQRLNDSRFAEDDRVHNIDNYIKLGPLGRAIDAPSRSVLLIDEIDKADIEFPNDLLHELDEMSFFIPELNKTLTATQRPIVLITSNAEKELPNAFLRRCVFHFIEFPTLDEMRKIVDVHFPTLKHDLLTLVLERFFALRNLPNLQKRPSTSELIDWIMVLQRAGLDLSDPTTPYPFLGALLKKEHDLATFLRSKR